MEVKLNPNTHVIPGITDEQHNYKTECPHQMEFEYINGWGVRYVGSACCGACKYNVRKKRVRGQRNFTILCCHPDGHETHVHGLSKIITKV